MVQYIWNYTYIPYIINRNNSIFKFNPNLFVIIHEKPRTPTALSIIKALRIALNKNKCK